MGSGMPREILDGRADDLRGVSEKPKGAVAPITQQPSYLSGSMAMVDVQSSRASPRLPGGKATTDNATSVLIQNHLSVRDPRKSIDGFDPALEGSPLCLGGVRHKLLIFRSARFTGILESTIFPGILAVKLGCWKKTAAASTFSFHGVSPFQVSQEISKQADVLLASTNPCVASSAKKTANAPGVVIVVYRQSPPLGSRLTDGAFPSLSPNHRIVLLRRDTEIVFKVALTGGGSNRSIRVISVLQPFSSAFFAEMVRLDKGPGFGVKLIQWKGPFTLAAGFGIRIHSRGGEFNQVLPSTTLGKLARVADERRVGVFPVLDKIGYTGGDCNRMTDLETTNFMAGCPNPRPAIPVRSIARRLVNVLPESVNVFSRDGWKWFTLVINHLMPPVHLLVRAAVVCNHHFGPFSSILPLEVA